MGAAAGLALRSGESAYPVLALGMVMLLEAAAPLNRAQRWKCGALCCAAYVLLGGMVVLPIPLLLFSALTVGVDARTPFLQLRSLIARESPGFVKNASDSLLGFTGWTYTNGLRVGLCNSGCVTLDRLSVHLEDSDPALSNSAWHVALKTHPSLALAHARKLLGSGATILPSGAGGFIARFGTTEEIRELLKGSLALPPAFTEDLFVGLGDSSRVDMLPDLIGLAKSDSADREYALLAVASLISAGDAPKLWLEFMADDDAKRREEAAFALYAAAIDVQLEIVAAFLDQDDVAMRRRVPVAGRPFRSLYSLKARTSQTYPTMPPALSGMELKIVDLLERLVADRDIVLRRAGLQAFSMALCAFNGPFGGVKNTLPPQTLSPSIKSGSVYDGDEPAPEILGEAESCQRVIEELRNMRKSAMPR